MTLQLRRRFLPALAALALLSLAPAGPGTPVKPGFSLVTALEAQTPDPLIGTWILNVGKSTYASGTAPKSEIRTFDFARDGKILCTLTRVTAEGTQTFGHWLVALDGEFYPEFSRENAGRPHSSIALKKIDAHNIEARARHPEDKVVYFNSTMTISPDGKTLTWNIESKSGDRTSKQVRVYDKEPARP